MGLRFFVVIGFLTLATASLAPPQFLFFFPKNNEDLLYTSAMIAVDNVHEYIPNPSVIWSPSKEAIGSIPTSAPVFIFASFYSCSNESWPEDARARCGESGDIPLHLLSKHEAVILVSDYSVPLEDRQSFPNLRGLFHHKMTIEESKPNKPLEVALNYLATAFYKNGEPLSSFLKMIDDALNTSPKTLPKIWKEIRQKNHVASVHHKTNRTCPGYKTRASYRNALAEDAEEYYTGSLWEDERGVHLLNHTTTMGVILSLYGAIKSTQSDEFLYREMMVHVPIRGSGLVSEGSEISVLIIGGMDGGILREVLKYDNLKRVVLVESNPVAMRQCMRKMKVHGNFSDPRVKLLHPKRLPAFFKNPENLIKAFKDLAPFDFVFVDVQDPGDLSSEAIRDEIYFYETSFFKNIQGVMTVDGVLTLPGDSPDFFPTTLPILYQSLQKSFGTHPFLFHTAVPFHGGNSAFFSVTRSEEMMINDSPVEIPMKIPTLHYNDEIHTASFVLPNFWYTILNEGQSSTDICEAVTPYLQYPSYLHTVAEQMNISVPKGHLLEDERLLLNESTKFQKMQIRRSPFWGRYLLLDDLEQCSERDEYVYHEMFSHVPLLGSGALLREEGASILIIGGGDGGLLKEVLRHKKVSKLVMVEIDREVVEACRRILKINGNYEDPRVELILGDALLYIENAKAAGDLGPKFDVVLVDINDPGDGEMIEAHMTAEALYSSAFYENIKNAVMRENSVMVVHAECPLFLPWVMQRVAKDLIRTFGNVISYRYTVPFFRGGEHVYLASIHTTHRTTEPPMKLTIPSDLTFEGKLYWHEYHSAAFLLPFYWKKFINFEPMEIPSVQFSRLAELEEAAEDADTNETSIIEEAPEVETKLELDGSILQIGGRELGQEERENLAGNSDENSDENDDDDDDDDDEPNGEIGEATLTESVSVGNETIAVAGNETSVEGSVEGDEEDEEEEEEEEEEERAVKESIELVLEADKKYQVPPLENTKDEL